MFIFLSASCDDERSNGEAEQTGRTTSAVAEDKAESAAVTTGSTPADTVSTPDLPENIKFKLLDDGTYCVYAVYKVELPEEIEIPGEYNGKPVTVAISY